ncbi:hypothetical protein MASR1M60_26000 [Rhodocyclaceae bacterium]
MSSFTTKEVPLSPNKAQAKLALRKSVMPALDSAALFADRQEVVITHGGETYLLRLTRQNRLILTK